MTVSRDMSKTETNVLNLIINRATFEEPIRLKKNQTRNRSIKKKP